MGKDASKWFQPSQRPGEVASARNSLSEEAGFTTDLAPGDSDSFVVLDNTTGQTQLVSMASWSTINGTFDEDVSITFLAFDPSPTTVEFSIVVNPPVQPLIFDPPIPVQDGERFRIDTVNDSGASIDYQFTIVWRPA